MVFAFIKKPKSLAESFVCDLQISFLGGTRRAELTTKEVVGRWRVVSEPGFRFPVPGLFRVLSRGSLVSSVVALSCDAQFWRVWSSGVMFCFCWRVLESNRAMRSDLSAGLFVCFELWEVLSERMNVRRETEATDLTSNQT